MKRRACWFLACCILVGPVQAEPVNTYVSVQMENDFFARTGDRYYTHGTQLSWLHDGAPPVWLEHLTAALPFYREGAQLDLVNYTIGQKIFTPDDTEATTLLADDRPYIGYLYASAARFSRITGSEHIDSGNMFELTVGLVGPSALGEQVQTGFHDLIGIDSPRGWEHQLEDEPVLGVSYSRFWRVVHPLSTRWAFGFSPHVSASLGNAYTYAAGGLMLRIGQDLKRDLSPPNIRPGFPGLAYFRPSPTPDWYFFVGVESRLVARDISLDGNTFSASHHVDKETLVGDAQLGFVYLHHDLRISFSQMLRTREFATQEENTHYGALNVSFRL